MSDLASTNSSFQQAIDAIVHKSQYKLVFEEFFPVFFGRISEIATFHFSFMLSLKFVDGVTLLDMVVLFMIYELFCFYLSQAMWEVCQVRIAADIIANDPQKARQNVMPLCGSAGVILILFLAVFWPLSNFLSRNAQLSEAVGVQLKIYIAIGSFCYMYTFGYQNLYQIENRELMIISVRTFTCIIIVAVECFFFAKQKRAGNTLHSCIAEPMGFFVPLVWLYYWNTGNSLLNIRNKTSLKITPSDFVVHRSELTNFLSTAFGYLGRGLLNFVQHFPFQILAFAAVRTINAFRADEIAEKQLQSARIYVFYVWGEYFRAFSFAASQVFIFDSEIYLEKKMFSKIISLTLVLFLYGFIVNAILLILIPYKGIFVYLSGGNAALNDYLASSEYWLTILKAFLLGLGNICTNIQNNYLVEKHFFIQIFILGVAKIFVAILTLTLGYKYEFEKLDIVRCFICSDLVGIFASFVIIIGMFVDNALQTKKEKAAKER